MKLKTNKTKPLTTNSENANYAELINSVKFSLPAIDDFKPEITRDFYLLLHQQNFCNRNHSI